MAKLELIFGPMFAGKSCELIRRIRLLNVCEKKFLIVKPQIDTRYAESHIVSHNFDKEECLALKNLSDIFNDKIYKNLKENINTIFIDEAQFFTNIKETILKILEEDNINIVMTGLDGDSNRNKFGEILDLIPYCDKCEKITALCQICKDGTPGIFSYRKTVDNNQVHLGAGDEYMAVCRKHYLELG